MIRQNGLLRQIERGLRLPVKIATELVEFTDRIAGDVSHDFYLPLIQKLVQTRQAQMNGAIFAFTAISPGEGVSYVIGRIAAELSRHSGENVLVATTASLCGLEPAHFDSAGADLSGAKVWRLSRIDPESQVDTGVIHPESLKLLRNRFCYVLVDCPALKESAAVLSISPFIEGVVLIVASGQAQRDQIEQAQSALASSSCNLLGLVLNKRTEPVPKLIAKFL